MQDNLNARQPLWKTTSMEDNLNGRKPQWQLTSMEKKCQWRINSMEEDLKEALQEDDISLFS